MSLQQDSQVESESKRTIKSLKRSIDSSLEMDSGRASNPTNQGFQHQRTSIVSHWSNGNSEAAQSGKTVKEQEDAELEEARANQPLVGGFALLRAAQLLNFDIHYLGLSSMTSQAAKLNRLDDLEAAARVQQLDTNRWPYSSTLAINSIRSSSARFSGQQFSTPPPPYYRTFLDELATYNPLQKFIDRWSWLDCLCRFLKISLSLLALMIAFDKAISTIVLCSLTKIEYTKSNAYETTNSSVGVFVLILVNLSSLYILFSTVFNGHLLWNLLSQRLFLVSKQFQYKTMLCLSVFIYLEYVINISFINNLYEWDFTSNNIQSGTYSVFANLRIFVTEQDEEHYYVDILLTIFQFARGIIRISPYITINYAIICLKEHINTIRNQNLLTDSLKKRQKLRLVVRNRQARRQGGKQFNGRELDPQNLAINRKKKVNFVTKSNVENIDPPEANTTLRRQTVGSMINKLPLEELNHLQAVHQAAIMRLPVANGSASSSQHSNNKLEYVSQASSNSTSFISRNNIDTSNTDFCTISLANSGSLKNDELSSLASSAAATLQIKRQQHQQREDKSKLFLDKIKDFDELESYITSLYIFTGRLNRFMSRQGLTVFFIVHNLVISVSVIVPEAARGGIVMVYFVRILVVLIAIVPFVCGQTLNGQLEQLSKQIDRIIIQQQFIHRRRDNLVRIRELIHDIRIDCGGMLNFNVETGIKYLVVAFASAFFIEQEHYKLTRRH